MIAARGWFRCGADELIDLIMRIMLEPGDSIVDCPPTFTMYAFDAAINDAKVVRVMRKDDFSLDLVRQERGHRWHVGVLFIYYCCYIYI